MLSEISNVSDKLSVYQISEQLQAVSCPGLALTMQEGYRKDNVIENQLTKKIEYPVRIENCVRTM